MEWDMGVGTWGLRRGHVDEGLGHEKGNGLGHQSSRSLNQCSDLLQTFLISKF
jgi:hypothetical protein